MYRHRPSACSAPHAFRCLLPTPAPHSHSQLPPPIPQRPTPNAAACVTVTHRHSSTSTIPVWSVGVRESATPANVETTALHSPILRSSFLPMTHSRVSRSAQGSAQHIRESVLFATVLPPVFLSLFSIFLLEGRQVWEQTAPLDLLHDVHKLSEPHDPVVPRAPHF